jgi:3-oxoacyl-[acyl-carrier protein] reductase
MKHRLENKRAPVTGGSRVVGAAVVMRLAREGANVALSYAGNSDRATGEEISSLVAFWPAPRPAT